MKTCLSCGRDLSTPANEGCLDCRNVQMAHFDTPAKVSSMEQTLRDQGLLRVGDPLTRGDEENRAKGWPYWQIVDVGPPVKVRLNSGEKK